MLTLYVLQSPIQMHTHTYYYYVISIHRQCIGTYPLVRRDGEQRFVADLHDQHGLVLPAQQVPRAHHAVPVRQQHQ